MNHTEIDHYFTTYDLGLSAALTAVGYSLDHLDKTDSRKVKFIFERQDHLDTAIQQYWANDLPIPALTYFNALKLLKNRIYSE
jgi:hypothetical protein